MSMNPLNLYVKLSRLVFSVEPTENWEDYDEFEEDFLQLYNSILCCCCKKCKFANLKLYRLCKVMFLWIIGILNEI